ncbi:NUDIX hydrolase [Arthrobacter sp. TMN-49]
METDAPLAPLEDACTIVVVRDGHAGLEVLMLERPGNSRAFGGAWVFPGGKVDPADRVNADGGRRDDFAAAQAAGLRELAEETGQQLSVDDLVWLAQWTPMQRIPRRFRTWFLLAAAASDKVVLNREEHQRYSWMAPAEALHAHAAKEMMLVPPTWVTLHHLARMESVAQALEQSRQAAPFVYETQLLLPEPGVQPAGGGPAALLWAGDEAYPGSKAPAGARHRLVMTGLPWVFERTV